MTELSEYIEKKVWKNEYPEGIPHETDFPVISMADLTDKKMKEHQNRIAWIFLEEELTYGEIKNSLERFSVALNDLGVRKGDVVAIYMSNSPDWIIAYHGAMRTGGIITGVSPLYTPQGVEYQLNNSEAKTIILHERYYPNLEKF